MTVNLVFFTKSGQRKDFAVKPGVTIIGRRQDCSIRIPRTLVSRKHCRIVIQDDKTLVQDLGSANGTYLNSQRIMEGIINAGDRLAVGPVIFTVQIDGQPEEIKRPKDSRPTPKEAKAVDSALSERSGSGAALSTSGDDSDLDLLADMGPLSEPDDNPAG